MDVQAEGCFAATFRGRPERTLVLITHRQGLLKLVDRLILVDQGAVVADGPRDQVLEALSGGAIQVRKGGEGA